MSRRLLVLGWHNVESTWCFPSAPGAGTRGLDRQLSFLRRRTNVVPLGPALCTLAEGRPLPPRAVAITFDDGYGDALRLAVPMLERLGLPATFFLVPGLLSRLVRPWWEVVSQAVILSSRDAVTWQDRNLGLRNDAERRWAARGILELVKRQDQQSRDLSIAELVDCCRPSAAYDEDGMFMDWEDARTLVRRGFSVASHSFGHDILSRQGAEDQRYDLARSRQELETQLGVPVELLAYPNGLAGDFDETTVGAARTAGYTHAVTTIAGWNRPETPPYEIHRFVQQPERGAAGLGIVPLHPVWRRVRRVRRRLRSRRTHWDGQPS
jgi:peptidoglycan/xylan/chitin deacetylase (PgdA/CDA1 family)